MKYRILLVSAGALAIGITLALGGIVPAQPYVMARVQVGTSPAALDVHNASRRVFVANHGDDTVSVIDGLTNTVIRTLHTGDGPAGVAVLERAGLVYVSNSHEGSVSVLDLSDTLDLAPIPVGPAPSAIVAHSGKNCVYVITSGDGAINVIDVALHRVVNTIKPPSPAVQMALNRYTNRLYVSHGLSSTVSVYDTVRDNLVTTIKVDGDAEGIALNPLTNAIYVANGKDVVTIDGDTNLVSDRRYAGVDAEYLGVEVATGHVFVCDPEKSLVAVMDGLRYGPIATVQTGAGPCAVAPLPALQRMFLVERRSASVAVIKDL